MIEAELAWYFDRLWPILRSITGPGVRQTHDILAEIVPLRRIEVPTGTKVFDWTIPREWTARAAYVVTPDKQKILDLADNNLHLVNYSVPFRGRITKEELDRHLHSLPELPQAIPYVTSYFAERWGFCLPHTQRQTLPAGEYDVLIDTEMSDGALTISDAVLPGESDREVLISTYTCHPSMANNELSGPLVAAFLYRRLAATKKRRLSYRFVFLPETIGSIAYLALHGQEIKQRVVAGYVVTCIGDAGAFTYKRSRRGQSLADRAAEYVLKTSAANNHKIVPFVPFQGSDERQYCSPGFDLPVGSIMRTMYEQYREYHTSMDDRDFVSFSAMARSVDLCYEVCRLIDRNCRFMNLMPYGEPQLGQRGLYPTIGAARSRKEFTKALMWVLNLADGEHDLLTMAERSQMPFDVLHAACESCLEHGLMRSLD